jgi:exodeoxyribonuclease VIII
MAKLGKITEREYNEIPAVRNSELGNLEKSWIHYKKGTERTAAMIFGSAFHMFVLEEPTFWECFVVCPKLDRRTTAGKAAWTQIQENAKGKDIIDQEDFDTIQKMRAALHTHPMAKNILHRSENEGAYTSTINGVEVKCKLDLENKGHFFDLKSCEDASPEGFKKSLVKYKYYRQAPFYGDIAESNGLEFKSFNFIAVEKKEPFMVAVYTVCEPTMDIGRKSYKKVLAKYKFHSENPDAYQGYSDSFIPLTAPDWLFHQAAQEDNDVE